MLAPNLLHRPSRTLVVTDLAFHFTRDAPLLTRLAMRCACGYPGCQSTVLERIGMKRPLAARRARAAHRGGAVAQVVSSAQRTR